MKHPTGELDRLRVLVDAGIALSSELSLDALLQRIVEAAADLTSARYAALGVINPSGQGLESLYTHGLDPETRAAIGELPKGRGILGAVIREARPLRLHDIAEDPRSTGLPPGHPEMRTFLGVPIVLRGVSFGNLYLTEKAGGADFTEEDEELTQLLAAQAAVAIENARLYESSNRWLRQLESLNEVGNALATEIELGRLLDLVVRRLRELVQARIVLIALPSGETLRIAAADGEGAADMVGIELDVSASKTGRVFERRRSERVDSALEDPEIDRQVAGRLGIETALFVPLVVRDRAIGVVVAHDKTGPDPRFSDDDLRLAETFSARAATAVDLSERVSRDALRRVVEAQELERMRLARELHDETGQALTSVLLGLRSVEAATSPEELTAALAHVREQVVRTTRDVRRLAVELRPSALDDFGLVTALERLLTGFAEESGLIADLESRLGDGRLPGAVETTLYRIVQEALTNVAKHAEAKRVSIVLTRRADGISTVIEDDGRGFDPKAGGGGLGLVGMHERVALVGGRMTIESRKGAGTTIHVEVPLV